jgi:hypothetical protein
MKCLVRGLFWRLSPAKQSPAPEILNLDLGRWTHTSSENKRYTSKIVTNTLNL